MKGEGIKMTDDIKKRIREHWDDISQKESRTSKIYRTRWWMSPTIIRHINQTICGEPLDGWNAGALKMLRQYAGKLDIALSVGCGEAVKEMALLENNFIKKFICFELSEVRIREGKRIAERKGLQDRIVFINKDFFETKCVREQYDLIFWDNSLHHMLDVFYAIKKLYEILKPGGIFFCNDFVGKTKFQWSDMELAIVNGVRVSLDDNIFKRDDGKRYPKLIYRPSIEFMDKTDPSEAADSASIIPAVQKIFRKRRIIPTGGLIYHLCLSGILSNIEEGSDLLSHLLEMDDETIVMGLSLYAFVLAVK